MPAIDGVPAVDGLAGPSWRGFDISMARPAPHTHRTLCRFTTQGVWPGPGIGAARLFQRKDRSGDFERACAHAK